MSAALLLDTCAIIWTANGDVINANATRAMADAASDRKPLYVSPISAWEIGILVARGRLSIVGRVQNWFSNVLTTPGVTSAKMPEDLLIESSFLPGTPPNDPADRIIITTAREYDLTIVTRDKRILDYAKAGHVKAMEC